MGRKENEMDLERFKQRHVQHWAENLEVGDKCKATIRHKTDGSKNRHNVEVIVIENKDEHSSILAWDGIKEVSIPY